MVIKIYPFYRIVQTIHQLEVFQYTTALDLNMGYFATQLSYQSKYMATIVTKFGKFSYNWTSLGMCTSGDIFQYKVDDVLGYVKGVKTYIDNILVLRKDYFSKKMEHIRFIFPGLHNYGLKAKYKGLSLGLREIFT